MALKVVNQETSVAERDMTMKEAIEEACIKLIAANPRVVTIIYDCGEDAGLRRMMIPDCWTIYRGLVDIAHELIHAGDVDM